MYVGKPPVIFAGPAQEKEVQDGIATQVMLCQPVVLIEENFLCGGIRIYDKKDAALQEPVALWLGTAENGTSSDIITAYRTMLVLAKQKKVTQISPLTAAVAVQKFRLIEGARTQVADEIGADVLQRILTEMPEPASLPKALALVKEAKVEIDYGCLTQEIADGNLVLSPALQELGVESPDVVADRQKRTDALVEPYLPAIETMMAVIPHREGCHCRDLLKKEVTQVLRKGIKDTSLVMGMALIGLRERARERLHPIDHLGALLLEMWGGHERIMMALCHLVHSAYESPKPTRHQRSVQDLFRQLTDLQKHWSKMPETVTV